MHVRCLGPRIRRGGASSGDEQRHRHRDAQHPGSESLCLAKVHDVLLASKYADATDQTSFPRRLSSGGSDRVTQLAAAAATGSSPAQRATLTGGTITAPR